MTRDEILNMPAGREMDALVFAKVFGGMAFKATDKFVYVDDCTFLRVGDAYYLNDLQDACRLPDYSTDIAAAWEVVEVMEGRNVWFKLENVIPNSDPAVYEVSFSGVGVNAYACEDTAPLAICRAALLAVMEPK